MFLVFLRRIRPIVSTFSVNEGSSTICLAFIARKRSTAESRHAW